MIGLTLTPMEALSWMQGNHLEFIASGRPGLTGVAHRLAVFCPGAGGQILAARRLAFTMGSGRPGRFAGQNAADPAGAPRGEY